TPMSSRKRQVVLSARAEEDFEDLLAHSLRTWGAEQKDAYKAIIDRALQRLAAFPKIGRARSDLAPGLRGYVVGQHVIQYRLDGPVIAVVRIVHTRMDISIQLDET